MRLVLLLGLAGLLGMQTAIAAGEKAEDGKVLAMVNDQAIRQIMLDTYVREQGQGRIDPANLSDKQRQQVLDELINLTLLSQDAQQTGLDKTPLVTARLQLRTRRVLAEAAVIAHDKENPVSEKDLRGAYDEALSKLSGATEYNAHHILVETEQEAKEIIDALKTGQSFEDLAKARSTDPTGAQGGDLGWFIADQMVPPFARALVKMKKGQYTTEPVKTRFGWHVIRLDDTRQVKPPKLDDVRDRLISTLRAQRLRLYIQQLEKKARIERK